MENTLSERLWETSWKKLLKEQGEKDREIIKMIGELQRKMIERHEYESLTELMKIMTAI